MYVIPGRNVLEHRHTAPWGRPTHGFQCRAGEIALSCGAAFLSTPPARPANAMSEYTATVHWQREPQAAFTDNRYSRRHDWRFDGGAVVPGSSSVHSVPLPYSDPAAVDPEEAFVAALSSCHMLWFLSLAARAGWQVDDYRDEAVGVMARNAEGRTAMTLVTLRPAVAWGGERRPDAAELHRLHHAAHEACYIANSVKSEVRCEPMT
jgi:organic hydroperoxide reductase OsmC/OhrA